MAHKKLFSYALWTLLALAVSVQAETTIAEKKASLESGESDLDPATQKRLSDINSALDELNARLEALQAQAQLLYEAGATEESFKSLKEEMAQVRGRILAVEKEWRAVARKASRSETYSLWHQPDTTLGQLILDFGSQDYVYVFPPEIANLRLSIDSQLPIPRENWNEMLEWILWHRGIGIRQLNPYLRALYMIKQDPTGVAAITSKRADLLSFPPRSTVCFVLSQSGPDPVRACSALSRFLPPDRMLVQVIGKALFLIGQPQEISEILKVYDFISQESGDEEYRMVTLSKIQGKEMELILQSYFQKPVDPSAEQVLAQQLKVLSFTSMPQALFLLGTREQLDRAQLMIAEVQAQLQDPQERVVYWYTCKHTEAEDLAKVLEKVYNLMINAPALAPATGKEGQDIQIHDKIIIQGDTCPPPVLYPQPDLLIKPQPVLNAGMAPDKKQKEAFGNFIVDAKSGSIIMVVEKEMLTKLKELIYKMDQPNKMVQIEVLLFEKRVTDRNSFGLNLLRMGAVASGTDSNALTWNYDAATQTANNNGILSFLMSRKASGRSPNFDLIYNFLLSQEDVHINASPSVTTVNQTPAKIAIVEEISINTGVVECNWQVPTLTNSYARAQYGITIEITPTVHLPDEEGAMCDGTGYVTLETEVTFDTQKPSRNDRPDVIRRNIKNQVRIADGQTLILGGLRRKTIHDNSEKVPFLGEIPGLGKLFSNTTLHDANTEMFIFITPRILYNAKEDVERSRRQELCRRPGDIPEFLACLHEAQASEKRRLLAGGLKMVFGRVFDRKPAYFNPCESYDD